MVRGERLRLTIERPAAGGRMIARHDGAIVFVSGAIPGEVVEAEQTTRKFMPTFADRFTVPAEFTFGTPLTTRTEF